MTAVRANWQRNAIFLLIAAYAVVLTLHAGLSRFNLDEWGDMAENFAWGELWQWGYFKHPPFFGWAVASWFAIFPHNDWFYYAFSSLNNSVALLLLWRVSTRYGNSNFQLFVIAAAILMQPFSFQAIKYNANTAMTPLWAAMILFYLRGLENKRWYDALALGIVTGLAMLAKYYSVVLVLALLLHGVFNREARTLLFSWLGALVAVSSLAVFAPHVIWLFHNEFRPIIYALSQGDGQFMDGVVDVGKFIGGVVIYLLPALLLAGVLRSRNDGYGLVWLDRVRALRNTTEGTALLAAGWLSLVITIVLALAASADLSIVWAIPAFVPLVIIVASLLPDDLLARNVHRVLYVMGIFFLGLIVSAPIYKYSIRGTTAKFLAVPAKELTLVLDDYWHKYGGGKSGFVLAGQPFLANSASFYSVYSPITLEDNSLDVVKGYMDKASLAARGAIVICDEGDVVCGEIATELTDKRTDAINVHFSVTGYDEKRQWFYQATILPPVTPAK